MAEAEVLPHRHVRCPQLLDEHLIDELLRALRREPLVERDHHQLADTELLDLGDLGIEAHQQLRRRLGPDHGERMRVEREHGVVARDHLAMAEMDAVELAHRQAAGLGLGVGEHRDLHGCKPNDGVACGPGRQPRSPTTGRSSPASGPTCASATSSPSCIKPDHALGRAAGARSRTPFAARRACSASSASSGMNASARANATGRSGSAAATSNSPIRVRRSCSQ